MTSMQALNTATITLRAADMQLYYNPGGEPSDRYQVVPSRWLVGNAAERGELTIWTDSLDAAVERGLALAATLKR